MQLFRALPILVGTGVVGFLACEDSTNTPAPMVAFEAGIDLDTGTGVSSSSSSGGLDATAEASSDANTDPADECGPGATQCCIKYKDGSIGCGGPSQLLYEACVAGNCQTPPNTKAPSAVVVRKCNEQGRWVDLETCGTNCTEGSDKTTVACGYCPPSGQAVCTSTCSC